jgi:hypothetical protein
MHSCGMIYYAAAEAHWSTSNATGTPYFRVGSFGTPITIRNDSGQTTPIEHSSYPAYKTLGTYQGATKRQTIQYQMLKKKVTTLRRNLALSTCSANAAWLYYSSIFSSIFMKGIGYPLSVSRLSKTQLKQLQAPITALTLNCLGYPKIVEPHSRFWVSSAQLVGICIARHNTRGRQNTIASTALPHSRATS